MRVVILITMLTVGASAQELRKLQFVQAGKEPAKPMPVLFSSSELSNPIWDGFQEERSMQFQTDETGKRRSLVLAGLMSAALPGAGEFYAESYLRSALFLAIEGVLWTMHARFLNQGNQAARDYKNFADAPSDLLQDGRSRWSAARYAERLNQIYGASLDLQRVARNDFSELNAFERQAKYANGTTFSHTLPPFGSQQYYELIGKYDHYAVGWDDYDARQLNASFNERASQRFLDFGVRRQEFNDILNRATTMVTFVILNHALSLIDAVIATAQYNERFNVFLESQPDPLTGQLVPRANLRVTF